LNRSATGGTDFDPTKIQNANQHNYRNHECHNAEITAHQKNENDEQRTRANVENGQQSLFA
jgi:hypothetical protein